MTTILTENVIKTKYSQAVPCTISETTTKRNVAMMSKSPQPTARQCGQPPITCGQAVSQWPRSYDWKYYRLIHVVSDLFLVLHHDE